MFKKILACVVLVLVGVAGAKAKASWNYGTWLGDRVYIGTEQPAVVGAQIQAVGPDGLLALTYTDPAGEAAIAFFRRLPDGRTIKIGSISVIPNRADPSFNMIRFNASYIDENGVQRDDIGIGVCGGHGIILGALNDPWGYGCPGQGRVAINGELWVNGVRRF